MNGHEKKIKTIGENHSMSIKFSKKIKAKEVK